MKRLLSITLLLAFLSLEAMAGILKGTIIDKQTKEPLTGATVQVMNSATGAVADIDGNYQLSIKNGSYTLSVKYVGYKSIEIKDIKIGKETMLNFELETDAQSLGEVSVVAQAKKNTEISAITDQRRSLVVQSAVSAQQISKTQDKDASEVIRRVPGVSIIDERFVMVRGLSQRYNNVWINGSAVPSSEADSRAFSFDIIPSSQIDNMTIIKSPAPEYPADFTGGFILIDTKEMPSKNGFNISVGGGVNDQSHFKNFSYSKGSGTDFLGFDNGLRSLNGGITAGLLPHQGYDDRIDLTANGFNNDWCVKSKKPVSDLKLAMDYSHRWDTESGRQYGLLAAVNYSNTYRTYTDMENSMFGSYDVNNHHSVYIRKSKDNQYNNDVRIGAMLNLSFQPRDSRHRIELKNIFNQIGKSRYTDRYGYGAQSHYEKNQEYFYSSRTTYNGQLTGKHTFDNSSWTWNAGYAYSNRNLPDRRRVTYTDADDNGQFYIENPTTDLTRDYTYLYEHIASGSINYKRDFQFGTFCPTLKAGAYGEYRTRTYNTRQFNYQMGEAMKSADKYLPLSELLTGSNYGADKLYLREEIDKTNDYIGHNTLAAGYFGVNLPLGDFNVYAGARYEYTNMELVRNTKANEVSHSSLFYKYNDLLPSVNATYKLNEKHQLRASYGKSVNRPEFREVSTSVYYDFELASNVEGNTALKPAYIHNIDFRYEWYPTNGETVSVALFYKKFDSPIEWTYTVNGGGTDLTYSYTNAKSANNYGIELDIRKNLDFIGLKDFSWSFNGSLIKSDVQFAKGSKEKKRAMQGQSPYLINTGIFYTHPRLALNAAVMYNRIGKRIVGVGRTAGTTSNGDVNTIPNSYEMPRNAIDLSVSKKWGNLELKAGIRDLLGERVNFKQFGDLANNGETIKYEETTKSYRPGRAYNLSVSYSF